MKSLQISIMGNLGNLNSPRKESKKISLRQLKMPKRDVFAFELLTVRQDFGRATFW